MAQSFKAHFLSSLPKPPPLTFGTHLDSDSLASWARDVEAETRKLGETIEASLAPRSAAFAEACQLLPVVAERLVDLQQQIGTVKQGISSSDSQSAGLGYVARLEEVISVLQDIATVDAELQAFSLEPDLQRRVSKYKQLSDKIATFKKFPIANYLPDRLSQVQRLLFLDITTEIEADFVIEREVISDCPVFTVGVKEGSRRMDGAYEMATQIGCADKMVDCVFSRISDLINECFLCRAVQTESVDFDLVDDRKFQLKLVTNSYRVVASQEFPINAAVLMFEFLSLHWTHPQFKRKLGKKVADLFPDNFRLQRGMAMHGFFYSSKISDQQEISDMLASLRYTMLQPGGSVGARVRGWPVRDELAEISDQLVPEIISERLLNAVEFCGSGAQIDRLAILLICEISRNLLDREGVSALETALIVNDLLFLSFLAALRNTEISLIFHVRSAADMAMDRLVPAVLRQRSFREEDVGEIVKTVSSLKQSVDGILTRECMKTLDERIAAEVLPSFLKSLVASASPTAGSAVGKLKNVLPSVEELAVTHILLTGNSQQIEAVKDKTSGDLRKKLLMLNPLLNQSELHKF